MDVAVKSPATRAVDVTVAVAPREGADLAAVIKAAEQTIADFFGGRLLGHAVLLAELGSRLYQLPDVENYRFSSPASDLAADSTLLPVLGKLNVTVMEAVRNV